MPSFFALSIAIGESPWAKGFSLDPELADIQCLHRVAAILLGEDLDRVIDAQTAPGLTIPSEISMAWLNMEPLQENFRTRFFSSLSLSENRIASNDDFFGSLDGLSAKSLHAGPFDIGITDRVSEHLKFIRISNKPTLKILSLKKVRLLYASQRTGIARQGPIQSHLIRVAQPESLLFSWNTFIPLSFSLVIRNHARLEKPSGST